MTYDEQAARFRSLAADTTRGCIVVFGWLTSQHLLALVEGVRAGNRATRQPILYVDGRNPQSGPNQETSGKSTQSRKRLLQSILEADCSDEVLLIDVPASTVRVCAENIGLLLVNQSYLQDLTADALEPWIQKILNGGRIVLTGEPRGQSIEGAALGPYLANGRFVVLTGSEPTTLQSRGAEFWSERRDVASWVGRQAESAGYVDAAALGRMAYGSFVSRQHRYLFVETPKAACTSWKRFIVELEGAHVVEGAPPYQRETTLEMLIHQRRHVHMPTLLDLPMSSLQEVLAPSSEWFKFAIVRNPYSRLVSVFENKVRLGEPGYAHLEARFGDRAGFKNAKAAFTAFVGEVTSNHELRTTDAHLRPQADLLMPRWIPYSRIFKMEAMGEAVTILNHRAGRGQNTLKLATSNESTGRSWRAYYTEQSALAVAVAYAEDFDQFDFARTDWEGSAESFEESPAELSARAKIVKRNAMIAHLHDLIISKP